MSLSCLRPFGDHVLGSSIEVRDQISRQRVGDSVTLLSEQGPRFQRFIPGRFVLFTAPGRRPGGVVKVRLMDSLRIYVPRRFLLLTSSQSSSSAVMTQIRRPLLFPGASYPVGPGVTALRGMVCNRQGQPQPFCRIAASLADTKSSLWAHGDERGEFLLLVGALQAAANTARTSALDAIAARITMYIPDADPNDAAAGKGLPRCEPLGVGDGTLDPIADGESVAGFTFAQIDINEVKLRPGQLQAQQFVISS